MSDIFKEVDEALKQDKAAEFWKKNGNLIIFGIILLIAATGIFSAYKNWKISDNEAKTSVILDLYKDPENFETSKLNDLNTDQKSLAQMYLARKYLKEENFTKAFDVFDAIRTNAEINPDLRGLSTYYARNIILNNQIEGKSLQDITMLEPTIWDGLMKLQTALELGSVKKDYPAAIAILDEISTTYSEDQSLLQQVSQLKYVYEYDLKKGTN